MNDCPADPSASDFVLKEAGCTQLLSKHTQRGKVRVVGLASGICGRAFFHRATMLHT